MIRTRWQTKRGYWRIWAAHHPYAHGRRLIFEHVAVAELALGRRLPDGAVVHHVNGDKGDNRPSNLVVCQDQTYHQLLHRRMDALMEHGDANYRLTHQCKHCGRSFITSRQNAKYCGVPCQRAAMRRRIETTFGVPMIVEEARAA